MKKFLKKIVNTQSDKCFTWMDVFAPKMPTLLKNKIEEEKEK